MIVIACLYGGRGAAAGDSGTSATLPRQHYRLADVLEQHGDEGDLVPQAQRAGWNFEETVKAAAGGDKRALRRICQGRGVDGAGAQAYQDRLWKLLHVIGDRRFSSFLSSEKPLLRFEVGRNLRNSDGVQHPVQYLRQHFPKTFLQTRSVIPSSPSGDEWTTEVTDLLNQSPGDELVVAAKRNGWSWNPTISKALLGNRTAVRRILEPGDLDGAACEAYLYMLPQVLVAIGDEDVAAVLSAESPQFRKDVAHNVTALEIGPTIGTVMPEMRRIMPKAAVLLERASAGEALKANGQHPPNPEPAPPRGLKQFFRRWQ